MISKVSSALGKFIRPISSSKGAVEKRIQGEHYRQEDRKEQQAQRSRNAEKKDQKNQQKNAPGNKEGKKEDGQNPGLKVEKGQGAEKPIPVNQSVPHTFIQLFTKLQQGADPITKWFGKKSYTKATRSQKNAGQFKKGSMYDRKVG